MDNNFNYVLHKRVYVTLSAGSEDATNLVVSSSIFASNSTATGNSSVITPLKVLIISGTAAVELDSTARSSATALAATATDQAVIPLDIWLYYDGNDKDVYTTNIANLDGSTFDFTLDEAYANDPRT